MNVCEVDDLEEGARLLAGSEHRALKHIIAKMRRQAWLMSATSGKPLHFQVRVWGTREVEPKIADNGAVSWGFHWHLLVRLDGLPEYLLVEALRERWPASRAVRVDRFRGKTTRQFNASALKIACYPVKARFTYHDPVYGRREWLPAPAIGALTRWMVQRGSRWFRFQIGR